MILYTIVVYGPKTVAEEVVIFFSLLRQEYPPILTSGEMLSHPGG